MTAILDVPALDLAPTVPSRIVYGTVLIPTEDRGPQGAWIEVAIPGEIKLPGEHTTITGRSARFPVHPDGSFEIRLPTIAAGIEPDDWALSIRLSWRPIAFPMRVPVGTDPIWIEDCIFPELMPSEDPAKYFLAGVQIRSVKTVGPDQPAKVRSDVTGGVLSMDWEIPRGPQGLPGATAIEGDEAVAGYIATSGQSATRDALMTTLTTGGTRPVGKGEIVLNARDMGAIGDGLADDTAALQAALDESGGRDVFIPHGRYRITATLMVPSDGVVRGENGTVLINDANLPTMIQTVGSEGPLRRLAAAVGTNDRTITTDAAHGFSPGDVVRFRSQRIATSEDAGEWQLAWATSDGPGPFFGEHATVQSVVDDTTFILDAGLVFPGYRPDATQETSPDAGEFATVSLISGARNVVISTLALEGPSYIAVRTVNAVDCLIENLRYVKYDDSGRFIQMHTSYRCEARNCWVSNEMEVNESLSHAAVNSYHIVASQSCGYDTCTAIRGTQAFDITYSQNGRMPSTFCYVKNSSSFSALNNSLTVHPGTYAAFITGNNFSENQINGPSIRANRSVVSNNVIRGSGTGLGLYITEGGGRESLFTGNYISNFDVGMQVSDGAEKQYRGWVGTVFSDNMIVDCVKGYTRAPQWARPLQVTSEGIAVIGNTFVSSRDGAIGVETAMGSRPSWGLTANGNTFRLTGPGSVAFSVTNNSRDVAFIGNTIWEAGQALARSDNGIGPYWPDPCVTEFSGNVVNRVVDDSVPANTATWRLKSADPSPHRVSGPDLRYYTETVVIRPATSSQATIAAGFPVEGADVNVEVVRRSGASVIQRVHSTFGEMHLRRLSSNTEWVAWSKRY